MVYTYIYVHIYIHTCTRLLFAQLIRWQYNNSFQQEYKRHLIDIAIVKKGETKKKINQPSSKQQ